MAARGFTIHRVEEVEIDAVAHHVDIGGIGTEFDQCILERGTDGNRSIDLSGCLRNHAADQRITLRIKIEIGPSCGYSDRLSQRPRQKRRGNPVRIVDMGVDQIEITLAPDDLTHMADQGEIEEEWREVRADLRQLDVAGMADVDAMATLLGQDTRIAPVAAKEGLVKWKPRNRRHDPQLNIRTLGELPQPVLDEDTECRALGVGIKRGDRQDLQATDLNLNDVNFPLHNYKLVFLDV